MGQEFPNGEAVQVLHAPWGQPVAEKDPVSGTEYRRPNTVNGRGPPVEETYGNGMVLLPQYKSQTGQVTELQWILGSSTRRSPMVQTVSFSTGWVNEMNRSSICAALILLGSISSFGCLAGVPVTSDPKTISVEYEDGTQASLTCLERDSQVCSLSVFSRDITHEFIVDFSEMGGIARLNYLHLTVMDEPFVALVTTGYYYSKEDNELLAQGGVSVEEVDSLECAVTFQVRPGARTEWDSVRILPQRQIYLKLTETGARKGDFFSSPSRNKPAEN